MTFWYSGPVVLQKNHGHSSFFSASPLVLSVRFAGFVLSNEAVGSFGGTITHNSLKAEHINQVKSSQVKSKAPTQYLYAQTSTQNSPVMGGAEGNAAAINSDIAEYGYRVKGSHGVQNNNSRGHDPSPILLYATVLYLIVAVLAIWPIGE